MDSIIKKIKWKGPPFSITIQKNDKDGKYVLTDTQKKFILKLEDMTKNDEGSENEKIVLDMLLKSQKDNLPRPLQFETINNVNVSIMVNSGVSLDGKNFKEYFKELPSANEFITAVTSLVNAVENLHGMGFIHRDITPSNVVYNRRTNQWTLIDFDFAVPFDYPDMGSEVIVNPNYQYIVHPWFKLNKDDYMYFDVKRLQKYIGKKDIKWYMLIDYYATVKVILYNFGLLMEHDETYECIINDNVAFKRIVNSQFKNTNTKMMDMIKLLMKLVAGFSNSDDDMHATTIWSSLTTTKRSKKRPRNDVNDIKGGKGRLKKTRGTTQTFELIK